MGTSRPCPRCMIYIKEAGSINSITFIDINGQIKTEEI